MYQNKVTLREWAETRQGWIFITSLPTEREALKPLHSLWIDLLVLRLLNEPKEGQKRVWFVIDELASLQKLPQLHTAITENRKSNNPVILGFQGKAQLEVLYGHLAEVMLSQPATSIWLKTKEPAASEWVSKFIGKVEIERLETRKSGKTEVREVVETKDGNLDRLISVNGKPLPEDQRVERERGLQRLVSNPAELKRSQREQDEDQVRSQRLLKTLPDALIFEYGEQRGDLVELKFKPNPHFRPPSHEAAVVHAMEGVLWVSGSQKRLAEISGRLTHAVKFGGGLLGHLDAGGHFYVKQEEVQSSYWELVVLDVAMKGKALFFKTIGVQEETKRSMFRRVRDDLTAAQGANLLNQQVRTTSGVQEAFPTPQPRSRNAASVHDSQ